MTRAARRAEPYLINGALALAAVIALFPLAWMVSVSVMAPGEASSSPPPLVPASPTLASYRELFSRGAVGRHLVNSVGLAVAATALSLAFNVTAGYAFAKLRFVLLKQVGLVNTYAGVLLPSLASASGIFLIRQYARTIPDELLEAARIDGAGELRIFWSIVLPVLRPVLVTLAVFAFLGSWNDFLWPLIVLSDDARQPLPVAIAALSREHAGDSELMMAGAVVTVVPVLAVFVALQRYYLAGLVTGSVKG
jgi:multiple sugar transport system permease protein